MDYDRASLDLHRKTHGKWEIASKVPLENRDNRNGSLQVALAGAAVTALASAVKGVSAERILPDPLDRSVAGLIAAAVMSACVSR